MIRTICSSFYFIVPTYISFRMRDTFGLFVSTIGMGVSIANHSHTFTMIPFRKNLFRMIDSSFMKGMGVIFFTEALIRYPIRMKFLVFVLGTMTAMFFRSLGDTPIEEYTEYQKNMHVLFHFFGISIFTFFRYYRYLNF